MWLDRFSVPSPSRSNSPGRAYSPAPRRPVRSGLGPGIHSNYNNNRSSASLDLSNNTSTANLGSASRLTNGAGQASGLSYEQKPPAEVENPSKVLRDILGIPEHEDEQKASKIDVDVDVDVNVDEDIDFGGLGLHEFALAQVQETVPTTDTKLDEADDSHNDDSEETGRERLEEFHQLVKESDEILKSAELYLTGFKAELGQVSAEIESLQQRSGHLNTQLENRRHVEKILGPAVENISVSPATVRAIAEGPIDEVFVRALSEVEARCGRLEDNNNQADTEATPEHVKANEDIQPLLQDLKAKAIERIRDYIVGQIKALRSPNINAQVIQQQRLVGYKELFGFLARQHRVLAEEIGQAYINTMKWYYSSHFARYETALEKMAILRFDSHDLVGAVASNIGGGNQQHHYRQQHDALNVGKRLKILKTKNSNTPAPAIPSYIAEESGNTSTSYNLEVPFRHFNQALIDNATAEYSVTSELFRPLWTNQQTITRKTIEILTPTFQLGQDKLLTKHLILDSSGITPSSASASSTNMTTDCIGILLCIRLTQAFALECQRRKVLPVMDGYVNYTNILLWPRFQQIMDLHCESLRKAAELSPSISSLAAGGSATTSTSRSTAAAFNLVTSLGGTSPAPGAGTTSGRSGNGAGAGAGSSGGSVAPHPITQRFGQLLYSLLLLSTSPASASPSGNNDDGGDDSEDEPLAQSLDRLRGEYEALMNKLAGVPPSTSSTSASAKGAATGKRGARAGSGSGSGANTNTNAAGSGGSGGGASSKRARAFLHNNYSLVLTIISDVDTYSSSSDPTIPSSSSADRRTSISTSAGAGAGAGTARGGERPRPRGSKLARRQKEHFAALVAANTPTPSTSHSHSHSRQQQQQH